MNSQLILQMSKTLGTQYVHFQTVLNGISVE